MKNYHRFVHKYYFIFRLFLIKNGLINHRKFDISKLMPETYSKKEIFEIKMEQKVYLNSKYYAFFLKKLILQKKKDDKKRNMPVRFYPAGNTWMSLERENY